MAVSRCAHLRTDGARCTMVAVNGKELCFFHESRWMRMRARPCPPSTFATVPLVAFIYPEDYESILENIHAIARSLAHGDIDARTASTMDRLMNTAMRSLRAGRSLEKSLTSNDMIRAFKVDDQGSFRALDDSSELVPEADEASQPQPAEVPNISAVADASEEPTEMSTATPALSVLAKTIKSNRPLLTLGFKTRRKSARLRAMAVFFGQKHTALAGAAPNLA